MEVIMIQGKMIQGRDDLSQVYKIRKEVFVEEQGIDESLEFDDADQEAIHVLVYEGMDASKAVATGRIIYMSYWKDCCTKKI
jgi:predicted GNAT family N-acyltransferase